MVLPSQTCDQGSFSCKFLAPRGGNVSHSSLSIPEHVAFDAFYNLNLNLCFQARNKVAVKDCSGVAVAVTCGEGDAPVRLTSGDLQAFTIERMAHVWRVSSF